MTEANDVQKISKLSQKIMQHTHMIMQKIDKTKSTTAKINLLQKYANALALARK